MGINKFANWNSRLCRWISDGANEKGAETYYNQALNTMFNGLSRAMLALGTCWFYNINAYQTNKETEDIIKRCKASR